MMVWIPGTELWRTVDDKAIGNNGRWENEQWGPLNNGRSEPCTAVFETAQELQLVFSETYWFYICLEKEGFWKQYTHCQQLGTHDKISADRIATFQRHLPNLHKLDLEIGSNVSVEWILTQPNARFSSLRLHSPWYSGTFPMDIRAYSKHLQTLVDLDLDYRNFTMKELLYILQDTPHLQSIRIPSVTLVGTEKLTYSPAWASRNLRKVSLGLYLRGDQPDIPICIHRSDYRQEELSPAMRMRMRTHSTQTATLLTPSFMEQLNSQSELCHLELSFNNRLHPRLSPFLQLSLDPVVGLPRLSNLRNLEHLVIRGLGHRLGQEEIEWMSRHWPQLSTIEVPILRLCRPSHNESCNRSNFTGQAPAYHTWFPGLQVKIPVDCYSCGECDVLSCLCRSLTEEYQQAKQAAENEGCEASAEMHTEEHEHEPAEAQTLQDNEMYYFDVYHLGRHYQHKSGFQSKV